MGEEEKEEDLEGSGWSLTIEESGNGAELARSATSLLKGGWRKGKGGKGNWPLGVGTEKTSEGNGGSNERTLGSVAK